MTRSKSQKTEKEEDEEVLERARALVETFRIVIAPGKRDGFIGYTFEMPGVVSYGTSRQQCLEAVLREQTSALVTIMENAIEVPTIPDRRDVLLNMRVSVSERDQLRAAAAGAGHQSLSEFLRATTLAAFGGSKKAPSGAADSSAARRHRRTNKD